jgi:hypothetical protein
MLSFRSKRSSERARSYRLSLPHLRRDASAVAAGPGTVVHSELADDDFPKDDTEAPAKGLDLARAPLALAPPSRNCHKSPLGLFIDP